MQTDADAVIIEAKDAAAPIYKGDYTASDLNAAVVDEKLYSAELSEAQMQNVFDAVMTATTTYGYNSQEPMVDYPALSGIKADLSIDGTENTLINLNGTALDQDRTYHGSAGRQMSLSLKLDRLLVPADILHIDLGSESPLSCPL